MRLIIKNLKLGEAHYNELVANSTNVTETYIDIDALIYKSLKHKYIHDKVEIKPIVIPPMAKNKPIINGVGDVVAKVAQPVANLIDKIFSTNIRECGGCKKRREKLNKMFPI